jgi:hypothetical protein
MMDVFTKHGFFSLQSMKKKGKVFFRRRLKNGMCIKVSCIAKKRIINNLHIRFKALHIEYYNLVAAKLHYSSKNVFTISTSLPSGPSPQFIQQFVNDFVNNRFGHIYDF